MTGQEIEDLRTQLNWDVEQFAPQIGIKILEYDRYKQLKSIEDPAIITKAHDIEVKIERENLDTYGQTLKSQATGPFKSGKVLSHLPDIAGLLCEPQTSAPITLEWHLSNRCNHNCPFCTFRVSVHDSPQHGAIFPRDLIEPLINDLKTLKVKAVVYSGGGEPLLYPQVPRIMQAVKNAGIDQALITNGTNLDKPDIAEAILETCDWVRISIDAGSDEIYKKTHGLNCDFEKTLNIIKAFVGKRNKKLRNKEKKLKPRIGVSYLLTMLNYRDILPSAGRFRDVGVDYFQVKPIVISAENRLSSGNIFWRKEIFNQLLALPAQSLPHYTVYTLGFKFVDMMKAIYEKPFQRCYGHPFYPVVTATGEVYVCCLMIGNKHLCYGKIDNNLGFKDLWLSENRKRIGESVNVKACPINCKLSETNKTLEQIFGKEFEDPNFLN